MTGEAGHILIALEIRQIHVFRQAIVYNLDEMSTNVREILERIMKLPDSEQMELREELARQDEQEWAQLSAQARQIAKERGIDDEAIARTIEHLRYGDRSDAR